MFVIPAIDIIGGQAVRLSQGDYQKKTIYDSDPYEVARRFEQAGAKWLHVVDLDGAKAGSPQNLEIVEKIRNRTALKIEFGGGIRDEALIRKALSAGANRVILGSRIAGDLAIVQQWLNTYGADIVAGIDMKDGLVATHGWEETGGLVGIELGKTLANMGCKRFIVTDIATDGMLQGPNVSLIQEWVDQLDGKIIASGGVSCLEDIEALADTKCEAVIVGKAIYEGKVDLKLLF
ncbi:1-(5-phosphoribosyl)-5-[(5-phosphoribosylamino)methylideneamino]imidazole-4-carboxamide isomerase [bacterium]|nr:1-(5-phosphoribosyl)-5-[(5-phosphoribosylamino)methylideneamino]imidazole-4-carboxamide isomerase [bacterium]